VRLLAVVLLAVLVSGCRDDHGPEVATSATAALDCAGAPYEKGQGNYDTGPESVQEDPKAALDDWFESEFFAQLPKTGYVETARHDGAALFTFSTQGLVVSAFVVRDDAKGPEGDHGWGVASYAACDPAEWPPATSDSLGIEVWVNPDGDRVPTSTIQSFRGPEHCSWQDTTFLWLGENASDGEFYGTPSPDLRRLLLTTYAAHVAPPADARDTGFARDGRHLWLATDGSAAYLVDADGDAERWPASRRPVRCD
jgi:hypothetical protein